jgi:arginyl-tRNA synthetase
MRDVISKILKKAVDKLDVGIKEEDIKKFIETPPSVDMGDYAFPCFFLAEKLKMDPHDIALEIRENISDYKNFFEDVQVSGPYINFFINRKTFSLNLVKKIILKGDSYGASDIGKGEKILIEHTSINPNASPHVGRARNAIIGDSLVRVFKFLNFETETHYYVNDVSKQIAMLVLAKADKLKFGLMLKKYTQIAAKVKKSKRLEDKVFDLLTKFESGDKKIVKKFDKVTKTCVEGQEKILAELGIKYDKFDYESEYLQVSKEILSSLEKTGKLFVDENGRYVLDQKGTSVEGKMKVPVLVLTRKDKTGLYPLRDIAYTMDKMKFSEKNIIVLGEDQKLYFEQLKEALKLLNVKSPQAVHYSFILISNKGKSKKMSTRKGDVVLLEDFLKDAINKAKKEIKKRKTKPGKLTAQKIGVGAVKYSIIKNTSNKSILFNLDEALNFEGDTGPYLLYSYARANSILKKAEIKKTQIKIKELQQKEMELIKKLSQFQKIVFDSYRTLNPSLIANYVYQLSQIFNEFYHSCPVINSEQEAFRLLLVGSFKQVMKNSLNLLGIEPLERM